MVISRPVRWYFLKSDSGRLHHPFRCDHGRGVRVLVAVVDHRFDSRLDNRLAALVAWEQCHIQLGSLEASTAVIQDGVQFTVRCVKILVFQRIFTCLSPRELVVRAAFRETVVSHGQNLVVLAHNAGSHLGVRILRAHTGKLGNCHEIFIPGNIILSFIAHTHFPCVFLTYFASALISYRRYGLQHRRGLVQCSHARSDGHPVLRRKHRHPGEPHAFSRFLPEMR